MQVSDSPEYRLQEMGIENQPAAQFIPTRSETIVIAGRLQSTNLHDQIYIAENELVIHTSSAVVLSIYVLVPSLAIIPSYGLESKYPN